MLTYIPEAAFSVMFSHLLIVLTVDFSCGAHTIGCDVAEKLVWHQGSIIAYVSTCAMEIDLTLGFARQVF